MLLNVGYKCRILTIMILNKSKDKKKNKRKKIEVINDWIKEIFYSRK